MLAVLLLALAVLVAVWDWNWFKGLVESRVEAATNREFEIGGDLDVDLGRIPVVSAERVRLGNPEWSSEDDMVVAERVEIAVEPWPLLRRKVNLPTLRLDSPSLHLETGPDGGGNWNFGDSGGDGRWDLRFGSAEIQGGKVRYLDAANDTDIRVDVRSADGDRRGAAAPVIVVAGGGQWEGSDFTLEGAAESPLQLLDVEDPYHLDVRAAAGPTSAHARGTILDPLRLRGFDLQFSLRGANLEHLYPLVGVALPPTPPYTLDGRLTRDVDGPLSTWHYNGFEGTVGDSDLGGDAAFTTGGERSMLRADLHSELIDFDDLAGFVGGAPKAGDGETTNEELAAQAAAAAARATVLPDTPYQLDKLRSMDADVRLKAAHVESPVLPLDDMDAHLVLEAGLLRLDPLNFGAAGGQIRSTIRMDARNDVIRTDADITARSLDLSQLLPDVEALQNAIGKVSGHAVLGGNGNSIAQMLGTSDGEVALGTGRGKVSNLLMELAGIDLAEIIKYALGDDRMIPIRCAFGDFAVEDGVMTTRALAFDTTDTILVGEGTIDLGEERLDLVIRPRPKDRSLLAFRSPLIVDGTFKDPGFRPDMGRIGLRAAIALGLASIAPPAALLATLELGPGEDSGCGGEYAE